MRIYFERSGGFTGMHLATTIDTNRLPPEDAARLLEALEESGLLEMSAGALESGVEPGVDQIVYEVKLEVGSYEQTYCMSDETAPESAQPLFRQLTRLARNPPAPGERPGELE